MGDPVAALREMRRACRLGGVVAARDSIYRAMSWYPADPLLARWLEVYCAVAEANGGEPDAGSHLLAWAQAAGFEEIACSATAWCYATPAERTWWGGLWADRANESVFATGVVERGLGDKATLAAIREGWLAWRDDPDGWMILPHGEILARG